MDGATTVDLLTRLEAMAARLDDQAAMLEQQAAEIADLKAENAGLQTHVAHLAAPATAPRAASAGADPKVGRRGVLRKVLGATAAAALLTVAKGGAVAEASSRTSVIGAPDANYGIAATYGTGGVGTPSDPARLLRNAIGLNFGVIGVIDDPFVSPPSSAGVLGQGLNFYGVIGLSNSGRGVHGQSHSGAGVFGQSTTSVGTVGVSSSGYGMVGTCPSGIGVYADSNTGEAVFGYSKSKFGLRGRSDTSTAVLGQSGQGIGVNGVATNSIGVLGQSASSVGAYGYAASGIGVVGEASSGLAGLFFGNVVVTGTLTAASKSAVVRLPDGTDRRMYCVEAPDSVFEDFGRGTLASGVARVPLDKAFAAIVRADDYDVFLTPYGDCRGLYVSARRPGEFEVREFGGGTASLPFGYRLVAVRKDPHGTRLERVTVPTRTVDLPRDVPDHPQRPDVRTEPPGPPDYREDPREPRR